MKRSFVLMIMLFFMWGMLSAIDVNIIMKDGSVIKGNMLGKTADEIFLQGDNEKAKTMKIADIKAVFESASGQPVDLTPKPAGKPEIGVSNSIAVEEVPGTGVYYGEIGGDPIYFYGGIWWRYGGGFWYRAFAYNGPWIIIDGGYVPYPVFHIGPRWFFYGHRHIFFRHRR